MHEVQVNDPNIFPVPRVEVEPNWIAHVRCEGARFHVLSYTLTFNKEVIISCSEPKCIYNKKGE